MMGKKTRRVSGSFDYFFVKPSAKYNVHEAAKRLIGIDRVREVSITEGDCGFVLKAEQSYGDDNLDREITDAVGGASRKAVCHCKYLKN
jgi:hypothetical protein